MQGMLVTLLARANERLVCKGTLKNLFSEEQALGPSVLLSLHSHGGQLHNCLCDFRTVLLLGYPGVNLSLKAVMSGCDFKTH